MSVTTQNLPQLKIRDFYRLRAHFNLEPLYQREGTAWSKDKKAYFIDSILNGYIIPPVYLEKLGERPDYANSPQSSDQEYAILDGKQRLTAIIDFVEDKIRLSKDFKYTHDDSTKAAGANYSELRNNHPRLFRKFNEYVIPGIVVHATTNDEIEDIFERLNSSVNLAAAEKRNAVRSKMRDMTNRLADSHDFFAKTCPIKNMRYKYRELASKMLVIEHQITDKKSHLTDLKAKTLMRAFQLSQKQQEGFDDTTIEKHFKTVDKILTRMQEFFTENDPLLKSVGTLIVYYLCFRDTEFSTAASRDKLEKFEERRRSINLDSSEISDSKEVDKLREYNAWVQSSNDGRALEGRARILSAFVKNPGGSWANSLDEDPEYDGTDEEG